MGTHQLRAVASPFTTSNAMMALSTHTAVARQSHNNDQWLPRFLFDVAYGCAALKTWEASEFVQFAEEKAKEFYYHDVDYDDDGDNNYDDARVRRKKSVQPQKADLHSRTGTPATRQAKAGDSQTFDVLDVVVGLWMHNARKDVRQACMMKEE